MKINYTHKILSQWINQNKVSASDLSDLIGVPRSHMSNILNLKRGMSKESLKKLHKITNIPIEQLLYPEDFKINPKEEEVA
jgi:antitoxin component HigA of HigAB toxin-antitoxin module